MGGMAGMGAMGGMAGMGTGGMAGMATGGAAGSGTGGAGTGGAGTGGAGTGGAGTGGTGGSGNMTPEAFCASYETHCTFTGTDHFTSSAECKTKYTAMGPLQQKCTNDTRDAATTTRSTARTRRASRLQPDQLTSDALRSMWREWWPSPCLIGVCTSRRTARQPCGVGQAVQRQRQRSIGVGAASSEELAMGSLAVTMRSARRGLVPAGRTLARPAQGVVAARAGDRDDVHDGHRRAPPPRRRSSPSVPTSVGCPATRGSRRERSARSGSAPRKSGRRRTIIGGQASAGARGPTRSA
jgi:hypothetical protein